MALKKYNVLRKHSMMFRKNKKSIPSFRSGMDRLKSRSR
ncbi:hypothetical protein LEP1GSC193_4075 [Leptospira alstonii serovar Pingchang str. 80-412]|uniref:Uncharacterized protein n=2 Tax=Leptospira alstonii TaxID=28452 RepID=M6CNV6_9LEPT|nr:hypothetical protein LEP1GSC194_1155 [Leptospira alstonii serovar Sichuan str. 79601]EQA80462.1 hypothetical protein LEP1GSC193_4075 [Leptospira alstonii serovar Pingchang str. 80-412]